MKKNILFVDDDVSTLKVGEMLLNSLGYEVLLADSGEEAIKFLRKEDISLEVRVIFLDLMMPKVDGFEVLKFMRNSKIKIPVVIQTGMMCTSELKNIQKLGARFCIKKPYTKEDMKKSIEYCQKFVDSDDKPLLDST